MKKVKSYKNFIIAEPSSKDRKENPNIDAFILFTKEEWSFGEGCRYEEHSCSSMEEAIQFIDSY